MWRSCSLCGLDWVRGLLFGAGIVTLAFAGGVAHATLDGSEVRIEYELDGKAEPGLTVTVGPGRELDCTVDPMSRICASGYGGPGFYVDVAATTIEIGGTSTSYTFNDGIESEGVAVTIIDQTNFVADAQLISSGLAPPPEVIPGFASVFVELVNRSGDMTAGVLVDVETTTTPDPVPGPANAMITTVESTDGTSYESFSDPSMSPNSTIAYSALTTSGVREVRVFDGVSPRNVIDSMENAHVINALSPDVNDAGTVVFWGFFGSERIIRVVGDSVLTLASGTGSDLGRLPKINNVNVVVFSRIGEIVRSDGTMERIIASAMPPDPTGGFSPVINDAGLVAFAGFYGSLGSQDRGIFATSPFGLANWLDSRRAPQSFLYGPWAVNESDEVVMRAGLDAGGSGIYVVDAIGVRTVADPADGIPLDSNRPGINDAGTVAFQSGDAILIETSVGLRRVVRVGDGIGGWPITEIGYAGAIDNAGRIAFQATLANGTQGIYVASLGGRVPMLPWLGRVLLLLLLLAVGGRKRLQRTHSHPVRAGICDDPRERPPARSARGRSPGRAVPRSRLGVPRKAFLAGGSAGTTRRLVK